jgi:hypothetical protein
MLLRHHAVRDAKRLAAVEDFPENFGWRQHRNADFLGCRWIRPVAAR